MKISRNASFSLWPFVSVHIPPIFSVLLTYSLKTSSLFFDPPCIYATLSEVFGVSTGECIGLRVKQMVLLLPVYIVLLTIIGQRTAPRVDVTCTTADKKLGCRAEQLRYIWRDRLNGFRLGLYNTP